jgi:hypothetical protein
MERETGIEPATSSLGSWHSTAELLPLLNFSSSIPQKLSRLSRTGLTVLCGPSYNEIHNNTAELKAEQQIQRYDTQRHPCQLTAVPFSLE